MKKIIFLVAFFVTPLFSVEFHQKYSVKDFSEGYVASNRIVFVGESTKMGLLTTKFEGIVKEFSIEGDWLDKKITKTVVSFDVVSMDTDVNSRNEKMHTLCFEKEKYPRIKVTLPDVDFDKIGPVDLPATIEIRGKAYPLLTKVSLSQTNGGYIVMGTAVTGFKELEIPDPSILIAKVKNEINIEFKVIVKKP